MGVARFLVVLGFALVSSQNLTFNGESSWEPCACADEPCTCVVYYLCGLDGFIINDGNTIVDQRLGGLGDLITVDVCPGVQVCCRDPLVNTTVGPSTSPETSSSQPVTPAPPGTSPRPETPRPPVTPPVLPTKRGCGLRDTTFGLDDDWTRINIDEGITSFAEFPWMLAILRVSETGVNVFVCGASLINYRVALTAAHCVHTLVAQDIIVRAGEWNTSSLDEPLPQQDNLVTRVILHPEYTKGSLFNDMALLVLQEPFAEAANVGEVCLPEPSFQTQRLRCVATGWGVDRFGQEGQMQTTLKKVDLPIVDSVTCQERLRTTKLGIFFRLNKSFICAGGEPDKDTCKGDGGGPLMCQSPADPERYVQVGIVSWGVSCKSRNIPAVYTNVPLLRPWVDSQLADLGISVQSMDS